MSYKIDIKDTRRMIKLMERLEKKVFNEDDQEELTTLSARFLFATRAMNYTEGYSLVDTRKKITRG
jgi:hypothetical protein